MDRTPSFKSIRDTLTDTVENASRFLWGVNDGISLIDASRGTSFGGRACELAGRSVLLATHDQFAAALAIIELDGTARRLVICPPDVSEVHLAALAEKAGVDAIVSDREPQTLSRLGIPFYLQTELVTSPANTLDIDRVGTEWVLLTSGTSGIPKMVAHTLRSLAAPISNGQNRGSDVVWGTFYDIRRYGGLQIFLRALLGAGSLVLSEASESPNAHLLRLSARSVTHLTGTPSHWRRALMSPAARAISPRYVRLSGEIPDQAILNTLRSFYPQAAIGHAFASTEAGVAFEVNDGLEGFPASVIGASGNVEIKLEDGSLRIRSNRTATQYIGEQNSTLMDAEGFVDTGDVIELRGDRYYFLGRKTGVINIGGLKVYPEEVEAQVNRHPAVRMSCVRPKRNPITGSLVVADVVLKGDPAAELKDEILKLCREALPRHKVPVALNFVPALAVSPTGKIARQ
jgi:acyl-coenzyme A synthetase/AMP-(fatty) acid ligase